MAKIITVGEEAEERIRVVLDSLVHERQRLSSSAADGPLLEANRRSIMYWQAKLSRRLIDKAYRPPAA